MSTIATAQATTDRTWFRKYKKQTESRMLKEFGVKDVDIYLANGNQAQFGIVANVRLRLLSGSMLLTISYTNLRDSIWLSAPGSYQKDGEYHDTVQLSPAVKAYILNKIEETVELDYK